ncbi:SwmB domain-containing protein [Verrucomicrobiaceae bacterium 227]
MCHPLSLFPVRNALFKALIFTGFINPAWAENRVLFIGNSFTIGSGESVAEIFEALAIAGGHEKPISVMRADGGKDYQWHAANAPTQTAITSQPWTHVILQNYSTEPTHITNGGIADHQTFGTQLYHQILANNNATQVILFETWSRAADHALISGTSTAGTFATTAEMQNELRENYQNLATTLTTNNPENPPVLIGPVGDAWEDAGGLLAATHPDYISLHGSDRYHGNDNGYFLAAAVFYATIYGVSPEGLHSRAAVTALNLDLTEDTTFLEKTAWETVSQPGVLRFFSAPENLSVEAGHPATFQASVRGDGPYSIQWFRGSEKIPGATELSYTIPRTTLDLDHSVYSVTVTNDEESITSDPVTLTVQVDETPPTLKKTTLLNDTTLELEFSERLALPEPTGFTVVNHGRRIPVTSVISSQDGTKFTLTLASAITGGFVLEVLPEVTDASGNAFASGPPFISPGISPFGETVLIDFGSAGTATGSDDDSLRSWNNVSSLGTSNTGSIEDLNSVSGSTSGFGFQMVRRFNGANSSGSTAAANFPRSATRDSLFGNTSTFSGLSNVFPAFRLTGLNPAQTYELTFYASRTGVSDNRETRYTVTGSNTLVTTLNPANNINQMTTLAGASPDPDGALLVELSPSGANTNSNQFTYLGVLQLSSPNTTPPVLHQPVPIGENIIIDWSGAGLLETSGTLDGTWTPVSPIPNPPHIEASDPGGTKFFRIRYQAE